MLKRLCKIRYLKAYKKLSTRKGEITSELAHLLIDDIYPYMGKLGQEKRVVLLSKYMEGASDETKRYWSHKSLVHSLAFCGRKREAIDEQTCLYHWACKHAEKYVLRIVSNLNTSGCWTAEGRIDDWIELYTDASERLENPEVSKYSRCDFLQFGAEILRKYNRIENALIELDKLESALGKPGWKTYLRLWLAKCTNRLLLYKEQKDWDRFSQVYTELNMYLELEWKKLDANFSVNTYELIWAAHDVGCCLVWTEKYKEAKRSLQVAVDLENYNEYSYFMLALSIWASEKDREKTLDYLKIAQDKYAVTSYNYQDSCYPSFLKTPEFSDVWDDLEFLKALGK